MLFGVGATLCGRPDNPNNPDKMVEKWLFEIENKFKDTKIDKYVIMPDHIHFIIIKMGDHTESGHIGGDHTGGGHIEGDHTRGDHTGSLLRDIVGWFKTMTTNEYIRGVKDGLFPPFNKRIWQRNYYEHIIRDEADYQIKWKYIDENFVKWEEGELYERR